MTSDDLIAGLVRNLEPVTPLALSGVRARRWSVLALVGAGLAVAMLGIRADLASAGTTLAFQAHVAFVLLATITAASAALALAMPGERASGWRWWLPILSAIAWIVWLGAELGAAIASGSSSGWTIDAGKACVAKILAFALIPGVSLAVMIARGVVIDARRVFALAALAAAGAGALGAELACPKTSPMHLLVWHAGPVLALTAAAAFVGAPLFKMLMHQRVKRDVYRG